MRDHWQALVASLSPLAAPTYLIYAPSSTPPYLVLNSAAWGTEEQPSLGRATTAFDVEIRVKAVAGSPEGVVDLLAQVRSLWSPNGLDTKVNVTGRSARIFYLRSEFIDVDESITIPTTNRHPAFGVDSYRLSSQSA